MTIDIKPLERKATEMERIRMQHYGYEALYVLITSDGNESSIAFDPKALQEFCPSVTVSEFLAQSKANTAHNILKYENALETNIHPYWKAQVREFVTHGKLVDAPLMMSTTQRASIQNQLDALKKISGDMHFAKITI